MTFALPDDLIVEVRRPERAVLTVAEILARPSAVRGTWDGPEPAAEPQEPGITFRLGWDAGMAGRGFGDICRAAADLAGHLAGGIGGWPGRVAHVRAWPVIDFSFQFEAGPEPVRAQPRRTYAYSDQVEITATERRP